MTVFLVMIGGALGASLRYAVGLLLMKSVPHPPIPLAMLVVNVIGSFGLGLFLGRNFIYFSEVIITEPSSYLFFVIGFWGSFTTFSTFSVETIQLIRDGKLKEAYVYVLLSIGCSILFFSGGFLFVSKIFGG